MKLIAYSKYEGGGMNGGSSSVTVSYTPEGRCQVCSTCRLYHSQPNEYVKYDADGLLEKLSAVCECYPVLTWNDLPERKIFAYDASSSTYSFTFEGGRKITLDSRREVPNEFWELAREIRELIEASERSASHVERGRETQPWGMGMMGSVKERMAEFQSMVTFQSKTASGPAKFCGACGTKFTGDEKFCPECGARRSDK